MTTSETQSVRRHDLRVPVFPSEKSAIENQAETAGLSVAAYLRNVGLNYRFDSLVDYKAVRELVKVNADLGRLGGLLKLWLTNDERTRAFGEGDIRDLLEQISETRLQINRISAKVLTPRKK